MECFGVSTRSSSPYRSKMCVYTAVSYTVCILRYIRLASQCVYNKMAEKWCRNKRQRAQNLAFGERKVSSRLEGKRKRGWFSSVAMGR